MQQTITLIIIAALASVAAFWFFMTNSVVYKHEVTTGAMEPTLERGSRLLVDTNAYVEKEPVPGEIIVYRAEHEIVGKITEAKRLIAIPGQTVNIVDCIRYEEDICGVYIDGEKLTEPEFQHRYYANGMMGAQSWKLPDNLFFFLGDNSRNSLDSRFYGLVPRENIIGKVYRQILPNGKSVKID